MNSVVTYWLNKYHVCDELWMCLVFIITIFSKLFLVKLLPWLDYLAPIKHVYMYFKSLISVRLEQQSRLESTTSLLPRFLQSGGVNACWGTPNPVCGFWSVCRNQTSFNVLSQFKKILFSFVVHLLKHAATSCMFLRGFVLFQMTCKSGRMISHSVYDGQVFLKPFSASLQVYVA